MVMYLLFVLLIGLWALSPFIGFAAAQRRGYSLIAGVIGGLLLGPLAGLMFLTNSVTRNHIPQRCPACAEFVKAEARVCKHCGRDLTPPAPTVATAS